MSSVRDKIAKTLDEAEWLWLKPHQDRNALLLISRRLDLLEVGVALAQDDTALIQPWIEQGLIAKPTLEQMQSWDLAPTRKFQTIIVQPYVLIQETLLH